MNSDFWAELVDRDGVETEFPLGTTWEELKSILTAPRINDLNEIRIYSIPPEGGTREFIAQRTMREWLLTTRIIYHIRRDENQLLNAFKNFYPGVDGPRRGGRSRRGRRSSRRSKRRATRRRH